MCLRRSLAGATRTRRAWLRRVGVLVAVLGLAPATVLASTTVEGALRLGVHPAAPVIPLQQIGSSRRLSLADYRGQVVILSFLAPWCSPDCIVGLPALKQLDRQFQATHSGVLVLDAILSPRGQVTAFFKKFGLSIPAMYDAKDALGNAFGIHGIPSTFAIDKAGRVVAFVDNKPQSLAQLQKLVAQAAK